MATYHHQIDGALASPRRREAPVRATRVNWGFVLAMSANFAMWGVIALIIVNVI